MRGRTAALAVAVIALFAALAATVALGDDPLPQAITHQHWNGFDALQTRGSRRTTRRRSRSIRGTRIT
jgi:hypothetical protein